MPERFIFGYEIPDKYGITLADVIEAIRQERLHPYHPDTEKRLPAPSFKKRVRRFSSDEIGEACMKENGKRRKQGQGPLIPMTQEYEAFLDECWHTEDSYSWKHLKDSQADEVKQWCFCVDELDQAFVEAKARGGAEVIAHLTGSQVVRRFKISFPSFVLLIKGHALTPLTPNHKPAIVEPFIELYDSLSERIGIGEIPPDNEDWQKLQGLMLKAWWFDLAEIQKFEDDYGLDTLEKLPPTATTQTGLVTWQDLSQRYPLFVLFKAMRDGRLKPLHSQTGAALSLPWDLLEYFAIFKNTENPEKDKEVLRRLGELVDSEPLLNDLPPDKLNEECSRLESAVFSATELDQAFSREPSGDDDGAKMKPSVTLAQSRWDRFLLKAAELRKDDDETTIEEIIKDPLVLQIWPSKKRPKESTLKRKLEGSGLTKRGRRKAE